MGNRGRDSEGRFSGAYRVNVESVPRLPTFPTRWMLEDPRGRPYFVFWTSEDGTLAYVARMERMKRGEAIRMLTSCGGWSQIPIVRRPLPVGGATAILYRCPGCWRPRRYLYLLALTGSTLVGYLGPRCQACSGLQWVSQGQYRGVFDSRLRAALANGRPIRDPYPRDPWDPRAVSDPRMVRDEFPHDLEFTERIA